MSRYSDAPKVCTDLAESIISQYFPELQSLAHAKIKILLDNKKRQSKGKFCLGVCGRANELLQYFTAEEPAIPSGYKFVIILNSVAWDTMCDKDKERLVRHELRHVYCDGNDEDGFDCAINPHNIEDFVEEISLNADDPDWARKVAKKVLAIYGS